MKSVASRYCSACCQWYADPSPDPEQYGVHCPVCDRMMKLTEKPLDTVKRELRLSKAELGANPVVKWVKTV